MTRGLRRLEKQVAELEDDDSRPTNLAEVLSAPDAPEGVDEDADDAGEIEP